MIKTGIVGATGYTGIELIRLISIHPEARLDVVTSRSEQGKTVAELFPGLRGYTELGFSAPDTKALYECDLVFFATPHATAMHQVPKLLGSGIKVIDLSADFRLKDAGVWEQWYGTRHVCPDLLKEAVYGLPEQNRKEIKDASLVANPGCYPTSVILALLPVINNNLVDIHSLIADAKSGVSGAGRNTVITSLHAEVAESFKAYGVGGHRHHPEICQALNIITDEEVSLIFTPHLVPMIRGIHATVYATLNKEVENLEELYGEFYQDEIFVDVMPSGSHPDTKDVRGTNRCQIAVHQSQSSNKIVVLSVIDNLVKGAAGQAIQNMNILFHMDESTGLDYPAFYP